MTQEINRQELVLQLRQLFGFRGGTAFELGEIVNPVANIADLDTAPFHSKIGGITSLERAAVVAQLSYTGLRCPTTSQASFRAVVRMMAMVVSAAQLVHIKLWDSAALDAVLGAPTTGGLGGTWDSNPPDTPDDRPSLQFYIHVTAVVAGNDSFGVYLPTQGAAVGSQLLQRDFVLAPGTTLLVQNTLVNTYQHTSYYWDEYALG